MPQAVAWRLPCRSAWMTARLALLTRAAGLALLPALVIMAWRSPSRRRAFAGGFIPIVLFAVYPAYLANRTGDAWSFLRAQGHWQRHLSPAGPLGGVWDGLRAGWAGLEQLISGSHTHNYWPAVSIADSDPIRTAAINLTALVFLVLFTDLSTLTWKRLGRPYGIYCWASLALPLSVPSSRWPLWSIPRFGLTLFPIFLALAIIGRRPRVHTATLAISALALGIAVSQWAQWQWVA